MIYVMYIYFLSLYLCIIQIRDSQSPDKGGKQKLAIMKNYKRFSTTEIVTYRLSNSTRVVLFDTLEEAKAHVEKERELHPRSKKFNPYITDTLEKKRYRF